MIEDWKSITEHTVVDRPEYYCGLQEFRRGDEQMMFIHLTVHKWSKETLKLAKKDFALLRQHVTCPLFAAGEEDDDKWANFVSLFGFKFLCNSVCTDGKTRRVFINFKDDKKNNVHEHPTTTVVSDKRTLERTTAVSDPSVRGRVQRAHESSGSNSAH